MSNWRPISSAPKDGPEILAWDSDGMVVVQWSKGKGTPGFSKASWRDTVECFLPLRPTHWMPLPEPPEAA